MKRVMRNTKVSVKKVNVKVDERRKKWNSKVLRVGTECSGLDTPLLALKNVMKKQKGSCKVAVKHLFSTEKDPSARKIIVANHCPEVLLLDCETRSLNCLGEVDVYVAGPPCQDFSSAGLGGGDATRRGGLIHKCVDAIIHCKAKLGVIENVAGLQHQFPELVDAIKARMASHGYSAHHGLFTAAAFGLPQTRKRIYFVFIRKDAQVRDFEYPAPTTLPGFPARLSSILDPLTEKEMRSREAARPGQPGTTAYTNLERTFQTLRDHGIDTPWTKPFAIDVDSTRPSCLFECSPCLTRARCLGFWITCRGRRMNLREMAKLQGFEVQDTTTMTDASKANRVTIKGLKLPADISDRQAGQLLGNAMSVPVIEAVLMAGLRCLGIDFGA